jgi:hypothetical protein
MVGKFFNMLIVGKIWLSTVPLHQKSSLSNLCGPNEQCQHAYILQRVKNLGEYYALNPTTFNLKT